MCPHSPEAIEARTGVPVQTLRELARAGVVDGGWTLAQRNHGANANLLASTELQDIDKLSGTPLLDGIAVRIETAAP